MALDLQRLASETRSTLDTCWKDLGISSEEQASLLEALTADVAAIYRSRVEMQETRRREKEEQVQSMVTLIQGMQRAMEESDAEIPRNGASLIDFFATLESKRGALQETWDSRHATLQGLHAELAKLSMDVGSEVPAEFATIGERMSLARIAAFEARVAGTKALKAEREATIRSLCGAVGELWVEMDFAPENAYEAAIAQQGAGLGWTLSTISGLQEKITALNEEKAAREERIATVGKAISGLWARLSTPEEEQAAFVESHCGLGDATIEACEVYLAKLRAEFAAKLVHLVADARAAITGVWNQLLAGPETRAAAFPAFSIDTDADPASLTEALYSAHEAYLAAATAELASKAPVLKAIEKRAALLEEKAEYEALIADPSRLLARGSSSARLREEKLERRVKKELPVVNKRLVQQVEEWQAAHGGVTFIVNDAPFLATLQSEEAAEARAKEGARAAREAAKADAGSAAGAGGGSSSSAGLSATTGRMSLYGGGKSGAAASGGSAAPVKRTSNPSLAATATAAQLSAGAIVVKPRKASGALASAASEAVAAVDAAAAGKRAGATVAPPPVPAAAAPLASKTGGNVAAAGAAAAKPAISVSEAARTGAARIIQNL